MKESCTSTREWKHDGCTCVLTFFYFLRMLSQWIVFLHYFCIAFILKPWKWDIIMKKRSQNIPKGDVVIRVKLNFLETRPKCILKNFKKYTWTILSINGLNKHKQNKVEYICGQCTLIFKMLIKKVKNICIFK